MPSASGVFAAIYTDEHVSPELVRALRQRGFEAQSAIEAGTEELTDAAQLAYAAERGMAILTFNVADFAVLARDWAEAGREHAGIILSEQLDKRRFGELLRMTLRLLDAMTADELKNTTIYLQQFQYTSPRRKLFSISPEAVAAAFRDGL